jgi:hypothetical protein
LSKLGDKSTFYHCTISYPFETKVISCPYYFGVGRELEWDERMELYRKQLTQEKQQKERVKEEKERARSRAD